MAYLKVHKGFMFHDYFYSQLEGPRRICLSLLPRLGEIARVIFGPSENYIKETVSVVVT